MATIDREREAFEKLLPQLLTEHRDEWVVMRDGEVVGFHTTFEQAFEAAVAAFGDDGYLVTQVVEPRPEPISFAWTAGVMFG